MRSHILFTGIVCISLIILSGCRNESKITHSAYPAVGNIERLSPLLNDVIDTSARIEVLASGFGWAEGPLWLPKEKKLLFTDVGQQKIYEWTEKDSIKVYLSLEDSNKKKPGPSALLIDQNNRLVILRYGHGEAVRMNSTIEKPLPDFTVIADSYNGIKFNNTNDAAYYKNGDMFMSDPPPPSGAAGKRLAAGLYRISSDGAVKLVTDTLSSPNGIAFSPDYHTMYVSNADSKKAFWIAADIDADGNVSNGRKLFDATGYAPPEKGHPDGLRVNRNGIIFATGPGGVFIFTPGGEHIGTIKNDQFNTNCVLDDEEKILFITAGQYLMRVVLKH